ncbi:hypothetical protein JYB62_08630 [Algoriphagus lutimaris]|uniref:hypothetical protein n=1 Tax=Algoriphagus lutimaris TaxID=613197 RepID=UPI00196A4646|nr:hypothetical protein [Algoriphagus lutimaris]MBN3520067.1 hypothetical protein [Algoriphagus lutimaris]
MNDIPKNQVNLYTNLRKNALGITADQIESYSPISESQVYGVMIDWEIEESLASLVAYLSGDASIYLSEGRGIIGGGNFENVRNEVFSLLDMAPGLIEKATKLEEVPFPEKGTCRIMLFTKQGFYCMEEKTKELNSTNSIWGSFLLQTKKVHQALVESQKEQDINLKN